MPKYFLKLVSGVLALVLSACGQVSQTGQDTVAVQETKRRYSFDSRVFESNRAKWGSSSVENYSIDINADGFLRPFLPAIIEVSKSKFISIKPKDPNRNNNLVNSYRDLKLTSIDEIFAFVESCAKRKPAVLDVVYDDKYGFPVVVQFDQSKEGSDDELWIRITNFRVK